MNLSLPPAAALPPLQRAQRQQLQRWYDESVRMAASGQHAGAHERLRACLSHDPGCLTYAESFLRNLRQWAPAPAGWFRRRWLAASLGRALRGQNWTSVQLQALDCLHGGANPVNALQAWARACAAWEQLPTALLLLETALEIDADGSAAASTHALAAATLHRAGRFDDAAASWQRVIEAGPEGAMRRAAEQALQRLRPSQRTEDGASSEDASVIGQDASAISEGAGVTSQDASASSPGADPVTDWKVAIDLANRDASQLRWESAQQLLQRAMQACPKNLELLFAWETLQLEHAQWQLQRAEQLADDEQGARLAEELAEHLDRIELEVFDARGQRLPDQPQWHWQAGQVLARMGNWSAAIERLGWVPLEDSDCGPAAALLRGELCQRQRRFDLALQCFQQASQCSPKDDPETWRRSRQRGQTLAAAMGQTKLAAAWQAELERRQSDA